MFPCSKFIERWVNVERIASVKGPIMSIDPWEIKGEGLLSVDLVLDSFVGFSTRNLKHLRYWEIFLSCPVFYIVVCLLMCFTISLCGQQKNKLLLSL